MARPPRRAGPVWAWALALLVLLVLIVMLLARRERTAPAPADPPAAPATETSAGSDPWDPAPRLAELGELEALASAVPLETLLPLGPAHTGVLVSFGGVAAADAGGLGVWLRTAEGGAVFVRFLEAAVRAIEEEARISGRGVVRFDSDGLLAARLARLDGAPRPHDAGFGEYYVETTPSRIRVP